MIDDSNWGQQLIPVQDDGREYVFPMPVRVRDGVVRDLAARRVWYVVGGAGLPARAEAEFLALLIRRGKRVIRIDIRGISGPGSDVHGVGLSRVAPAEIAVLGLSGHEEPARALAATLGARLVLVGESRLQRGEVAARDWTDLARLLDGGHPGRIASTYHEI